MEYFLYVNVRQRIFTLITGTAGPGGAIQDVQYIERITVPTEKNFLDEMYQFLSDWNVVRNRRIGKDKSTVILKLTERDKE